MQKAMNVDPVHGFSAEEIVVTGAVAVRFPLVYGTVYADQLAQCAAFGLGALPVFAWQSMSPAEQAAGDFHGALQRIRTENPNIPMLQLGNEPDQDASLAGSESSWCMSQGDFSYLLRAGREVYPGLTLVAGALVTGNPTWLDGVDLSYVDSIAYHPYGKDVNTIEELSGYYHFGLPVRVTELGTPHDYWADESQRAAWHSRMLAKLSAMGTYATYVFCYSDLMVAAFGIVDAQGQPYESYAAFQNAAV